MSKSTAGSSDSDVLKLYNYDGCPFGQRFWIAALEKEEDPKNPKNFEWNEVNYYNIGLPLTKEFLSVHNTVPAGIWKGKPLRESMPMVAWADETFKSGNNLHANEEKTKAAIAKFTSGEFDAATGLFKLLGNYSNQSAEQQEKGKQALFAAYQELGRAVKASGGPFILGAEFSAADISVYPFIERAKVYLPAYGNIAFPSGAEFADFLGWVSAVEARPSVAITRADRLPRSLQTQPFGEAKREPYLVECAEYTPGAVKEQVRRQLRFAPAGKRTADIAKAAEEKKVDDAIIARVDSGKGSAADLLFAHVTRLYTGADKYLPLLADDAEWEAPFEGSIGRPTVHKGKADVSELVQHRKKALADFRFHAVRISPLSDNEAVAQLSAYGRTTDGDFGKVYDQPDLVFFLSSKDGKISKVREFNDPARLAETFGYKIDAAKH